VKIQGLEFRFPGPVRIDFRLVFLIRNAFPGSEACSGSAALKLSNRDCLRDFQSVDVGADISQVQAILCVWTELITKRAAGFKRNIEGTAVFALARAIEHCDPLTKPLPK
jgi:hypothetical protein